MTGMYFVLRSGVEHRQLWHKPRQVDIVEKQQPYLGNDHNYLLYFVEDVSKNHQFGLKGRKIFPKL